MIFYREQAKYDYAKRALATEGLDTDSIHEQGRILYAYFPLDCGESIRLAHNRVQRRGNELFEVYGYGTDHISKRAFLRFALKGQQS